MDTVVVKGRFTKQSGAKVEGPITFTPHQLWIKDMYDVAWATMHFDAELKRGYFKAELSPGGYTVKCPVGEWTIVVPDVRTDVLLVDLLPARFRS